MVAGCVLALGAHGASAQRPGADAPTLAQALDRCMAVQAVRLTKTDIGDDEMYARAAEACRGVKERLAEKVGEDYPAAEGAQALREVEAQSRPGFMGMVDKVRGVRAGRGE